MTHPLPPADARVDIHRRLLPGNAVRVTWRPSHARSHSRLTATVVDLTADASCVRLRQRHGGVVKTVSINRIIAVEVLAEGRAAMILRYEAGALLRDAAGLLEANRGEAVKAVLLEAEKLLPGLLPRPTRSAA